MKIKIIAGNLILFVITFIYAAHSKWGVSDLIWCLWTSSFILGYTFFFASLIGMIRAEHEKAQKKDPNIARIKARLKEILPRWLRYLFYVSFILVLLCLIFSNTFLGIGAAIALAAVMTKLTQRYNVKWEDLSALLTIQGSKARFILGLLSNVLYNAISFVIAFTFAHFCYAGILDKYFPIFKVDQQGQPIEYSSYSLFIAFLQLTAYVAQRYWPFLIISAASRMDDYREAISPKSDAWVILKPFINVIQMHIMIMLLSSFEPFGLHSYTLYSLLIIYFFPWGNLFRFIKRAPTKH